MQLAIAILVLSLSACAESMPQYQPPKIRLTEPRLPPPTNGWQDTYPLYERYIRQLQG